MNRIKYLLIMLALACGSGNGDGDTEAAGSGGSSGAGGAARLDECDPAGTWEVTYKTGAGDCLEPGTADQKDTLSITKTSVTDKNGTFTATFDEVTCSIDATTEFEEAETAESYGMSGTLRHLLDFDGDTMSGSAQMQADILEGGVVISSCIQDYEIEGTR